LALVLTAPPAPFLTGGDVSLLARLEQLGVVYRDGGAPRDLLAAFKAHGANTMRLRLFHTPDHVGPVVNDLPYTVALGRRVKAAGLKLLLDLHYSDTWADPHQQHTPAAWRDLDFEHLTAAVETYSRESLAAMVAGGAAPDIVQVGNEITPGFLWPAGQLTGERQWPRFAQLLQAGIRGVLAGAGDSKPAIMIHVDCGGDAGKTRWFFDHLTAQGVEFDQIGLSYYPNWHGSLDDLKHNLEASGQRFGKPMVVVETGYPWRSWGPKDEWATAKNPLFKLFALTPEGQRQYLEALIKLVRATPGGLGQGVLWWAPEWLPTKDIKGSWSPRTLVDDEGNLLPAASAFSVGAAPAAPPAGA
jgi:arabinogalactan endo-1,4-beta-galactosidase